MTTTARTNICIRVTTAIVRELERSVRPWFKAVELLHGLQSTADKS